MSDDAQGSSLEVRRGHPSEEELAALLAVVSEEHAAQHDEPRAPRAPRSRWEISARGLRTPLLRERGWGGFSG